MNVASLEFVSALLIVSAFFFFIPGLRGRQIVLAVCNAVFLALYIPNAISWAALAAFMLSGYVVTRICLSVSEGKTRSRILAPYVVLLVAAFVYLKKYQFLELILPKSALSHLIGIVGISYMLFRQIHFVVDTAEAQIESPSLWEYLNYQLSLFGLLAGPIQRFQQFRESWSALTPILNDRHELLKNYARIFIGLLKIVVLGAFFMDLSTRATENPRHITHLMDDVRFAALFYGFPAYVYFNFSGYCDIVIAGAALVGIRMPENFDQPYLSRNIVDFWTRWHATLTHWIRDYIFMPLYKNTATRWPSASDQLPFVCYFVALFIAGVWHGSSWNFVIFGLLHGGAFSANKMWEQRIVRKKGRPGLREYMKSPRIRLISTVVTFHFVCVTFLFFAPGLRERIAFLREFAVGRAKPAVTSVTATPR